MGWKDAPGLAGHFSLGERLSGGIAPDRKGLTARRGDRKGRK